MDTDIYIYISADPCLQGLEAVRLKKKEKIKNIKNYKGHFYNRTRKSTSFFLGGGSTLGVVVGPKNIENPYKTPYLRKNYNIKWRRGRRKRCLDTPLSERTPRNHHATTTGQQKTLQIPLRRKATSSGPISTLTPQQLLPRNTTKMVKKKKKKNAVWQSKVTFSNQK